MPAIPPKNYLLKVDEFIAHWALVNAALGTTPLTLQGGYLLATLSADRTALAAQLTAVAGANANAQAASADRDLKRQNARERMRQFNQSMRGLLSGTLYPAMLPKIPNFSAAPGLWSRAMDDMAFVWNRVNTDAPAPPITVPFLLTGAYTRANFVTDQTALNAAFTTFANTRTNASSARDLRDQLFKPLYGRLVQYRKAVQGRFPSGHSLINSLPTLSPAPGSTPDPVNLGGAWDTTLKMAHLTYTASTDPHLAEYQLRVSLGGTGYSAADESVVATNPPGILFFNTDTGLVASGSTAFFKVYVITTTGNEKGSKTLKIVRP